MRVNDVPPSIIAPRERVRSPDGIWYDMAMVPLLLPLALVSFLPAAPQIESDALSVGPAPEWVVPTTLPRVEEVTETLSVPAYCLLADWQVDATGPEPVWYVHQAWHVRAQSGLDVVSQLEFEFDPSYQDLVLHTVRVHRGEDVQDRLDLARWNVIQRERELELRLYDGTLTALHFLEDVRVGDTVEFSYSLRGAQPAFGEHFFDALPLALNAWVAQVRHRVRWRADEELLIRPHGTVAAPEVTREGDIVEYVWNLFAVQPVQYELGAPPWCFVQPWIQLTDLQSWKDVVGWGIPFYSAERELSDELATAVAEIRATSADPQERVLAALRIARDDVRYLGIELGRGSYEPTRPDEVFARRFGDCKDKALLLISMLDALGIEAHAALVHTQLGKRVDTMLPSPLAFDHVIVRVELGDETYWIDPTDAGARGQLASLFVPRYGRALLLRPGETDLVPVRPNPRSACARVVETRIDARDVRGRASMSVTTAYHGREANLMRFMLAMQDEEELARQYVAFYRDAYPTIESAGPLRIEDDEVRNVVRIEEKYSITEFWIWDEQNELHRAGFFASDVHQSLVGAAREPRELPLSLPHPQRIESDFRAHLGDLSGIAPQGLQVENEGLRFAFDSRVRGDALLLTYELETKADHVAPGEILPYVDDVERIAEVLYYEVVWEEGIDVLPLIAGVALGLVVLLVVGGLVLVLRLREGRVSAGEHGGLALFTIWTHPRRTVRRAIDAEAMASVLVIVAVAGVFSAWDQAAFRAMGDEFSVVQILAGGLAAGPLLSLIGTGILSVILLGTGRMLGGTGSFREVFTGFAYPGLLGIWFGLLWFPSLGVLGEEMFRAETPNLAASRALLTYSWFETTVALGGVLWVIVAQIHGLAEAHRISAWRALGAWAIPFAACGVVLLGCLGLATFPRL